MAFQFSQEQLTEIQTLIGSPTTYPTALRKIADWAEGGEGVDKTSILWFRGAADINQGIGPFSQFVRTYAAEQYDIRYHGVLSGAKIQIVSNKINKAVLDHIVAQNKVPSPTYLANIDSVLATKDHFGGDEAAWSGNILFLALGNSAPFYNTIINEPGNTYDLLASIKAGFIGLGAVNNWSSAIPAAWNAVTGNSSGFGYTVSSITAAANATNAFAANAYGPSLVLSQMVANNIVLGTITNGDQIVGTSDADFIHGGAGNDVIKASGGLDIVDGGIGSDTIDYSNYSGGSWLYVNIFENTELTTNVTGYADPIGDTARSDLYNIEKVIGAATDDKFLVDDIVAHLELLDGGDGIDELSLQNLDTQVALDLSNNRVTSDGNSFQFENFESVILTKQADTLEIGNDDLSKDISIDLGESGLEEDFLHNRDVADYSAVSTGLLYYGGRTAVRTGGDFLDGSLVRLDTTEEYKLATNSLASEHKLKVEGADKVILTKGNDTFIGAKAGTIIDLKGGADKVYLTPNVQILNFGEDDRIAIIGQRAVYGGHRNSESDSPWAEGAYGTRYAINKGGELVIANQWLGDGKKYMYIANQNNFDEPQLRLAS